MINKLSNSIAKTRILFLNFEDERLELENGVIITYNIENKIIEDNINISLISFYKFSTI